ncbi:MAG: tRNA (adenosine(37)-N6)-threonylcarbamoyltransferase complex ATPase subunit type 1 TsaE [Pseudomonadota bacterium]
MDAPTSAAPTTVIAVNSPDDTATLAARVARGLTPGACLLLEGPIGAGKTTFARALIQTLLEVPEDVPSPTFTLVQTYETARFDVWHCDLYRLTSADELTEIGLEEAFEHAVTLIEWPDRLGDMRPEHAITLHFEPADAADARVLTVTGHAPWVAHL